MNKLNRDNFKNIEDTTARMAAALQELAQFEPRDPPYLSDIFVNLNDGGQAALVALEHHDRAQRMRSGGQPFIWTVQVRRDEWGNVPSPGDKVVRKVPINRKNLDYQPVRSSVLNSAMVDGSFSEKFEDIREFEVDSKGCISCMFDDAGYFLFNWGVHHKTNRGMCGKQEYSTEPVGAPNGNKLHVHYWRYSEVDADDYKKLPKRDKSPRGKRGVDETNPNAGSDDVRS